MKNVDAGFFVKGAVATALLCSVLIGATASGAARSAPASGTPDIHAFDRPARATDRPPRLIVRAFTRDSDHVVTSRRVAAYVDGRGRHAILYVVKTTRQWCLAEQWNSGEGGGCSPPAQFLSSAHITVAFGHLLFGVGDVKVARVVVVGTRGAHHLLPVTRDGGFIYDCKAYNGCGCVVARVEAYDAHGTSLGATGQHLRCRKR